MNNRSKYYIRIDYTDSIAFEEYIKRNKIWATVLSHDCADGKFTHLYNIELSMEEETMIKLSFPLIGCMPFDKRFGRLKNRVTA